MIKKIKMEVTPDLSKRVQEIVFANGGYWGAHKCIVDNIYSQYLFIWEDKTLSCCRDTKAFEQSEFKEVSTYDFIASQGEQEWLPKYGEKAEFSDDTKIWSIYKFECYNPSATHKFENNCTESKFCRPISKTKTITIDGKDIEISLDSYEAFKEQFKD